MEAKSGETIAQDFFVGLDQFASVIGSSRSKRKVSTFVVYGGDGAQRRTSVSVVPWSRLDRCAWWSREE